MSDLYRRCEKCDGERLISNHDTGLIDRCDCREGFLPDDTLQQIYDTTYRVEWCFVNGVPRYAETRSDWDMHQAADDHESAGRHGHMYLNSDDCMVALVGEDNDE